MSDHFSGPRALAGPAGDICDLYAFPSPDRHGRLVLVMDLLPRADAAACFSDAIVCRFRIRPVTVAPGGPSARFAVGAQEYVFDCTFDVPRRDRAGVPAQRGRCIPPTGEPVDFAVHDERGASADGMRVFAGLRSDPFFLDLPALLETVRTGRPAFTRAGTNSLAGFNVLSVVVEADCAPLLSSAGGSLFAVVGETVAAGKLPIRLERVGRPEVKNTVLAWKDFDPINRDLELRDLYNLEDAFHLGKDYRGAYRARLNANLAFFDRLDGRTDWPIRAPGSHPLTELLLADHLVVDVAKPYAEDSFFEIERAMLAGREHATCGGRSPNDDVMDTLYSLLIKAGRGERISDGVDRATAPAGRVFPYLARPNPSRTAAQEPSDAMSAAGRREAS
jgi:Domain of unknown function (DUF4331)